MLGTDTLGTSAGSAFGLPARAEPDTTLRRSMILPYMGLRAGCTVGEERGIRGIVWARGGTSGIQVRSDQRIPFPHLCATPPPDFLSPLIPSVHTEVGAPNPASYFFPPQPVATRLSIPHYIFLMASTTSSALGFMPPTTFSLLRPRASSSDLPPTPQKPPPLTTTSLRQPRRITTGTSPHPPPPVGVSSPSKSLSSSSKSTLQSSSSKSTSTTPFPTYTGPNPEELKAANARAMRALQQKKTKALALDESCFVYKRGGRKHHAFPMKECPYPCAVDREALDLDVHDQNHLLLFKPVHRCAFLTPNRLSDCV